MDTIFRVMITIAALVLIACGAENQPNSNSPLVINELVSSNDGVSIDEEGQTEDWLELANSSDKDISLMGYYIADSSEQKTPLPNITIPAQSVLVFWADDDTGDGELHLPFKLSSSGDALTLFDEKGDVVDSVDIPPLKTNQAFARYPSQTGPFSPCRYATPNKVNGDVCGPPIVPTIEDSVTFSEFGRGDWPAIGPDSLGINEIALFPSRFIEVKNFGLQAIDLSAYRLLATPMTPDFSAKNSYLSLPAGLLEVGELVSVAIPEEFLIMINGRELKDGMITLVEVDDYRVVDSVPFMHWPDGSALARRTTTPHQFRFCMNETPNEGNDCEPLLSRELGDRVRGLYTPGDFSALAAGGGKANIESIKFVIDLENSNDVYLLGVERWPLHYTFVREILEAEPKLDRCDASENREFNSGWYDFSQTNYSSSTTRLYHLGTLSKHANAKINNVEFTFGDEIVSAQMKDAFYRVTQFTEDPYAWSFRPQDSEQVTKAKRVEGKLPIVSPEAPFKNIVFQGLAPGLAYGVLTYVETQDLPNASLGNRVIVVTNDVPNDIDFVGGLITEAFQTPLAHVNILSQSRNTPNMALPGASKKPEFSNLLGKLVRLEVTSGGFTLVEASQEEAQAFWVEQAQDTPVLTPRLDSVTKGLVDLKHADFESLPAIGAKAAQMAEIFKVDTRSSAACREGSPFSYPVGAFAIPMSYYMTHFQESGGSAYLALLKGEVAFETNPSYRKESLKTLRQMILDYPVTAELMTLVEDWMDERYGEERVRFRSSSNTEDLSNFNGAGLYDSLSAELGSKKRPVDVAIKTVWASLWNLRAYDERVHANVDQSSVAMGVLVHSAFTNERANGVGVGRNVLNPARSDQFYFNSQAGEASVTNPAPGVVTEQLIYQWPTRTPTLTYHSNSSIVDGPVINSGEVRALACALNAVQEHFRGVLDPLGEQRWFTMETEFKFLGQERALLLKQARPYQLGRVDIPSDCREL